jgi:hypothetical protein
MGNLLRKMDFSRRIQSLIGILKLAVLTAKPLVSAHMARSEMMSKSAEH